MALLACGRVGFDDAPAGRDGGVDGGLDGAVAIDGPADAEVVDAPPAEDDASEPPPGPISSLRYSWHQEVGALNLSAIAHSPVEGLVVGGQFDNELELGGMTLSEPGFHPFLATFEPLGGTPQMLEHLGGRNPVQDLSSDSRGNLAIAVAPTDALAPWARSLRPDRTLRWVRGNDSVRGRTISANDDGHSFVGGSYLYESSLEGTDLVGDGVFTAGWDGFVMRVNALGSTAWVRKIAGASAEDVALLDEGAGQVVVIVEIFGTTTIDLGDGDVPVPAGAIYVLAAYSSGDGSLLWFDFLVGDVSVDGLAVDRSGGIYLTGSVDGSVDLAGEALTGNRLGFLVAYDSAGAPRWSKTFGSPGWINEARAVVTDADRNIFVGGIFSIAADFGAGPIEGAADNGFIAAYDMSGAHLWSFTFPSGEVHDLAVGEAGRLFASANAYMLTEFGGARVGDPSVAIHFVASFER